MGYYQVVGEEQNVRPSWLPREGMSRKKVHLRKGRTVSVRIFALTNVLFVLVTGITSGSPVTAQALTPLHFNQTHSHPPMKPSDPLLVRRKGKPLPPITLSLTSEEKGTQRAIKLEAKPNTTGDRMTLEIRLPRGVNLVEGETDWEGSVEDHDLEIFVEGEEELIETVSAVAIIHRREDKIVQLVKMAPLTLSKRPLLKPKAPVGGAVESSGIK